jgi:hypothetical protein
MSKVAIWNAKAAELRALADATDEAERKRILLVLAEDCAEIAAEVDRKGRIQPTGSPVEYRLPQPRERR